ncbi:MAG: phage portal protein [Deltaproteobacteria bacterium]|nr:phage portal protein [Deltaproteobacteria bacterium]
MTEIATSSQFVRAVLDQVGKKDHSIVDDHDQSSGLWSSETNVQIDPVSLKNLFFTEDWVFIVVNLIAMKISNQKLRVIKKQIVNGKTLTAPAEDHPIQFILNDPNAFQDPHSWVYTIVIDLILMGNSIIWDARSSGILQTVPAERVSITFKDQTGELDKYIISADETESGLSMMEFNPNSIIHIKRPNPSSLFWGLSPFVPGRKAVLFNRFTTEFLNNYYIKGATPSLKVEIDKDVNEKSALRMLRSFQQAHSGRRNQHAPLLLPKGVKASAISTTLADQQLSLYVQQNRETIIALLGVPKHELSLQSAGSLGSQETRLSLKNFWQTTLKPTMRLIEGGLNKQFASELGTDYEIRFDLSNIDALKDDEVKKAELAQLLLQTHTVNEIRQTLYDRDAHPDGDGLLNMIRLAPQLDNMTPSVPPSEFSPEDGKQFEDRVIKVDKFLSNHKEWWSKYQKQLEAISRRNETDIQALVLGLYLRFLEQAIPTLRQSLSESTKSQKAEIDDKRSLRRKLRRIFDQFEDEFTDDYVRVTGDTLQFGYEATFQVPFNLSDEQAIRAAGEREEDGRRSVLEARGIDSFNSIKKSEVELSMQIIDRGLRENKTVDQIAKELATNFSDTQKVDHRARRIARTETATAVMLGRKAAMNDASEVVPGLQKVWLNANDTRVRGHPSGPKTGANHWRLQGETRGVNERFSNGLKHPLDADAGRPDEVINCRCDVLLLPPGEAFAGVGSGTTN